MPTQSSSSEAVQIMQEVFFWDEERCLSPEGRAAIGAITEKLDAYAAESMPNVIKLVAERDAAVARAEAAESCTTCDGQPHASGSICICGGSGRRSDETKEAR